MMARIWVRCVEEELMLSQLLASLDHITTSRKLEAIFWMALGYLSMTGYDRLGFYYIARSSKNFSTGINFNENFFLVYRADGRCSR